MRFVILIQFCLLIILGIPALAQNTEAVEIDCNMLIDVEIDLEPFDYAYVCDAGDCYPEHDFLCHFQLAVKLAETCEFEDLFCRNAAFLEATAAYTHDDKFALRLAPQPLVDNFPQVMSVFAAGDFETARTLLEYPALEGYFPYPLLLYSRGLVYEMLNQSDRALIAYGQALDSAPNQSLVY